MKYFWDTLLDADLESDALGWQYISGTLPDGREFDRIDNPEYEGYKFDPNGEYVRRWLPELARLPTEWIHHPWDAPESVLQAAGVELGSNYPLPVVEIEEAKARLRAALTEMWHMESASRAAAENGQEEGLGDSSEIPLNDFPQELQMDVDDEHVRATNNPVPVRRQGDQMVPTVTSSLVRSEEEASVGPGDSIADSRPEVPSDENFDMEQLREEISVQLTRNPAIPGLDRPGPAAESTSSWLGREGGLVPVWSPPSNSSNSEHIMVEEAEVVSGGYLHRHSRSHQINWQPLSSTRRNLEVESTHQANAIS